MGGGKNWKALQAKGKENYSAFVDYNDRATYSNFCKKCGAWKGSLGLEPKFDLFIKHLCDIFDEVKRVLKDTGTIWVNIGDTYWGGGQGGSDYQGKEIVPSTNFGHKAIGNEYINKSLCLIPQRFAIEMVNRGWVLRNTIIWFKRNCMPCSAKDRFTVDFEYLYFFSKQKKYYFEQQFEEYSEATVNDGRIIRVQAGQKLKHTRQKEYKESNIQEPSEVRDRGWVSFDLNKGRNKRCVWEITTQPFPEAHFAVYPEELCITPIKAGCPEFVCKKCGKAREKIIEEIKGDWIPTLGTSPDAKKGGQRTRLIIDKKDKGYTDCGCNAGFNPGIVLDPFSGAGTTCLVAKKLGRNYIGIEINPEYVNMSERRIHNQAGLL